VKKLEDIPKKHAFEAPEGYFDRLPGLIQARLEKEAPARVQQPYFRYAVQYALPVVLLLIISWFALKPSATPQAEDVLAGIATDDLMAYLEEADLSTDELLDNLTIDEETADAIEEEVYLNIPLEGFSDETDFDLDNL
jgi:hypothetical protein